MKHCLYEKQNGVGTISLNRPEIHNAFGEKMMEELGVLFKEAQEDSSLRLMILKGNGKSFCSGVDINWMKKMKDAKREECFEDSLHLARFFHTINGFKKPLLGFVHGMVLGGGVGLVAVCDEVVCENETVFGFAEVRLGLVPAVISPYVVAKIGESGARASFMSGKRFSAFQAKDWGLVHHVVDKKEMENKKKELVSSYLAAAPIASMKAKSLIREIVQMEREKTMNFTCDVIARARISKEGQEGMKALLEKKKPSWCS